MRTIPIAKPLVGDEEAAAVAQAIASGMLASGPRVKELESRFAAFAGAKHAIATSNGTTALHAALVAGGIQPGDDVIVPAFTFVATANAVLLAGATPVFADIDPASYCVTAETVRAAFTPRTRAIMPVHLYGHPAPMPEIEELARETGAMLLGDAAQAHGARLDGRSVGAFGDAEAFSFYPTKNMTTGEGGMVTTNDDALAARVRSFVNHGRAPTGALGTYDHLSLGTNYRMTDVHAAIGLVQLGKLPAWNETRRANAGALTKRLEDVVRTPTVAQGAVHVFHQYTIRTSDRAALLARLQAHGVGHGIYYPKTLPEYPHLAAHARGARFPHAERAAREVVSLPVHPALVDDDVARIAGAVRGDA